MNKSEQIAIIDEILEALDKGQLMTAENFYEELTKRNCCVSRLEAQGENAMQR